MLSGVPMSSRKNAHSNEFVTPLARTGEVGTVSFKPDNIR
jgi:hypothetical protein